MISHRLNTRQSESGAGKLQSLLFSSSGKYKGVPPPPPPPGFRIAKWVQRVQVTFKQHKRYNKAYCRVFSLDENVPVSHALSHETFLSVETALILSLLYAQETTTAHLRSRSCFLDRLVILNEDRILSND